MKSKYLLWLFTAAFGLLFTSCSKDPLNGLTEEDARIYITDHSSTANFANYSTFSVSDSAAVINNGRSTKELTTVDQAYINAIKAKMQEQGYQLVNKSSNPDIGITVNRIYNTSTGIISYQNYYDAYGSYYDPFYWGYGGYGYYSPYSYASYTIREGALGIDFLDLKNAATSNRIEVIWAGLIRGSGVFNSSTAANQVNMLFNQSPYLKK